MSTLSLPARLITQLINFLRYFLWRKFGSEENGMALVAWDKISKPKLQGGLGILNTDHNKALVMKNVHKFFNRGDLPWFNLIWEVHYSSLPQDKKVGSFRWKTHLNLLQTCKQSCLCIANSGSTI